MAEFDNSGAKNRNNPMTDGKPGGAAPGMRPRGANPQQTPVSRPPAGVAPGHQRPLHQGQPQPSPLGSPPLMNPAQGAVRDSGQSLVRPTPQGQAAGNLANGPVIPQQPSVGSPPYPSQSFPARAVPPQPGRSYAGAQAANPTPNGRPVAPQPVSPYAGAAAATPAVPGQPPNPQPGSPYAGGTLAGPASVPGAAPLQPPSLYAGAAVAAPGITTAINDEEKKRMEEQERIQRYSELTFFEKASFSGTLVWGYRTNFIFGAVAVVVFHWCLQHLIDKYLGAGSGNILLGLPVLFLSSFASLFVGVCFASLISYIADHGDPESTADLLFGPTNGNRFLKIAPALGIWALIFSGLNFLIFTMNGSSSLISILFNVSIISCTVPITMCVVFYLADNEDFSPAEGVGIPLKMFVSNIIGWLLFIPVSIFTIISTLIAIIVVWMIPPFGFIILGIMVVLSLIIVMLGVSYIFTYGCYVYKETAAKDRLAQQED